MSDWNLLGSSDTITGLFSSELANMRLKTCSSRFEGTPELAETMRFRRLEKVDEGDRSACINNAGA